VQAASVRDVNSMPAMPHVHGCMDATTSQEFKLIALLPLPLETVPKEDSRVGGSECFGEESELGSMTYYTVH